MANLLVRGIDEALVQALKERAVAHGRSAEGRVSGLKLLDPFSGQAQG